MLYIGGLFGSTDLTQAKKNARQAYREHYANVWATAPKERSVEYELEGWGLLCKFLGKKISEVPFPHRNEAKTIVAAFGVIVGRAIKHSPVVIATVMCVGAVSVGIMRRFA